MQNVSRKRSISRDTLKKQSPLFERGYFPSSLVNTVRKRLSVLITLLLVQSISSFILEHFQDLLSQHVHIMMFLTMLIGAGGNAANQSAVRVIRDIAVGNVSFSSKADVLTKLLIEEATMGIVMGLVLSVVGFLRAGFFLGVWSMFSFSSIATVVAVSLFLIVISAVVIGTSLPLLLDSLGADPAIAGPSVQVFMDILGVLITCSVAHLVFAS